MEKKRLLALIGFLLFLYLFIFSLVLIKTSFAEIGKDIFKITKQELNPINAFGIGWLITLVMLSSGATASALLSLHAVGILGTGVLIYMILGTRIGTTITALSVSLISHAKKRRDFRHGFEIGLANLVYAFPIAILMFLLEYFFDILSRTGSYFLSLNIPFKLNFIDFVTLPLIKMISFLPEFVLIFFGIFLLLVSLREMPRFMLSLWGEDYLRKKIGKYLGKKWKAFLIGFFFTAFLLSTSITITLLIPVVVLRLVNLKKVIPYMIGANLGGVIDIVLSGLVIGRSSLPGIFAYVSFSFIGLLWLFNTDLLFNVTKFISKRTLHVSMERAVVFVLFFVLLALILVLI